MKWPVLILALQLSFAAGFMSLVTTTASKRLQVRVMTKRVDRNYRSSPRKPKTKKTSHVLSNPYLNTINKPSKRSVLLAYWKKLNARGVTRLVANTLLAYLFVGSASRCIVFSCSWYLASRQTLLSPLAPGQWTNFSRVHEQTFANCYGIFLLMLHIARPLKVALALSVRGYWDAMVYSAKERFKVNQVVAVVLVTFFVNILCSCVLLAAGVTLASLFSGVPIWR